LRIPSFFKGFIFMVMMYTCSYYENIFIRKVARVFSRKGFPKVKYGVYRAYLFYVMSCNAFTLHYIYCYNYGLLLHYSYVINVVDTFNV
jgi:hypothetical protein